MARQLVKTSHGEIRAAHVVVATHYPMLDPGHGSRFEVDGTVLEGPAVNPLERRGG